MERSLRSRFIASIAFLLLATAQQANAIPIFAQRYHLSCETCHSVLPELNAFGRYFRARAYQLPADKHGTTILAMRYQLEWEKDPVNTRRFTPGGVVLGNVDVGAVSAFVHYNLGAQGGPSGFFLAYLANYNAHTRTLYRAGLFELPLAQSPGQRLDDLQGYGYYGAHVGLNDLPLASPRWGAQLERTVGASTIDAVVDLGEFKGAAYGGAPIPTGETSSAARPELALFAHGPIGETLTVGASAISGERRIVLASSAAFNDSYDREGVYADYTRGKLDLTAEQWYGHDANVDGSGSRVGSTGGWIRAKYYVTPHGYVGIRYDASANPVISRDLVYYGAFMITPHARFVLQDVQTPGAQSHLGAAITVGFPWPPKL